MPSIEERLRIASERGDPRGKRSAIWRQTVNSGSATARINRWHGYDLIAIGPLATTGLHDQDHPEAMDATWEDRNGRLPHEPGYSRARPCDA